MKLLLLISMAIPASFSSKFLAAKSLLLGLTVVITLWEFLNRRFLSLKQTQLTLLPLTAISVMILDYALHSNLLFFAQAQLIFLTALGTWLVVQWGDSNRLSLNQMITLAVYGNILYALIKLSLLIGTWVGWVNPSKLAIIFNIPITPLGIKGYLVRLQTPFDTPSPYLLFFVLHSQSLNLHLTRTKKYLFIGILLLNILTSFSRVLWAIGLYALFTSLWISKSTPWKKVRRVCLCCIFSSFLLITLWEPIESLVALRFTSQNAIESDDTRLNQIEALYEKCLQAPFLGSGLGSYAEDCIRDPEHPFNYEVQWLAYIMQTGLLGASLAALGGWLLLRNYIRFRISQIRIALGVLVVLFLLSGWTNPYLFSLSSGILYGLFFLAERKTIDPLRDATYSSGMLHPIV